MIVSRFGATWSGAYQLGQASAQDSFPIVRPPSLAQVGGISGSFDFYGDDAYPLSPSIVEKSYKVSASTWAGIEIALDALKKYTIGVGRSKLWGLCRDNTRRWAWAKCVGVSVEEINKSYLRASVKVQFQLTEGLWYAENISSHTFSISPFNLTNAGTYRALVKAVLHPISGISWATLHNASIANFFWSYIGAVAGGQNLTIDAAAYHCTVDNVDAYSHLTIGGSQIAWMYLLPGVNVMAFNVSNECSMTLYWWNTFL